MDCNPVTLSFRGNLEKEYRKAYFANSVKITRIALVLAGLLYGGFGMLDFLVIEEHVKIFFIIRYLIVTPTLGLVVLFSFHNYFNKIWQFLLFFSFVLGGLGITIMISLHPHNYAYYGGLMLIFTAGYFFIRLRFLGATLAGWTILLMFNALMLSLPELHMDVLIPYNFFYVSANLIGMFGAYYTEKTDRKNFLLNREIIQRRKELEEMNKTLENRVEKRTQALKESENRFRNLADLLPLMVYEVDLNGNITYVNQQVLHTMRITWDEIIDNPTVLNFTVPEERERASETLKNAFSKQDIARGEFTALRKDGTTFPVMDYSSPIVINNEITGLRSVVLDLTEQKQNERLRTEVAVARQSAEFKQNFLANMSHEIRTPLMGIMGIAEILEQTKLDTQQKDHVATLIQSTENLREIINQILDYSKIEAGKVEIKPSTFEVSHLIMNAKRLFKSVNHKPIELITEIDPDLPAFLFADFGRVQQIISNLVSNATKFTLQGTITLKISRLKDISNEKMLIHVEVEDTGIGILPEKQELLFTPFTQLDHRDTRTFEGTGLGLSICKDLAMLLKGDIGVESSPGKGSRFWFTFEATHSTEDNNNQTPQVISKSSSGKTLRILLAEDKIVNQKVIGLMLSAQGHKVTYANNGKQALEIFTPEDFDIVLMDIQMPVMDGITATEHIRNKYNSRPLIVGLSANAFEGDKEKYMGRGMNDYLTKPVKGNDFKILVNKWFKESE
jgi:PAS domain S-box-containing protein